MLRTLCAILALLLGVAPTAEAQRVILDFEKGYPEDQFYFLTYNAQSAIQLRAIANGHVGKSTAAAWAVHVGEGELGYAGFGYLHRVARPANPFPDLTPFTHLSLWFNNTRPAAGAGRVAFRFELHEGETETDADGRRGTPVWIYESRTVLTAPPGWTRLLIPLVTTDRLGGDGFAIPPGGFRGNGELDLDRIRHWAIVLLAEGEPVGTRFEGTTLFDFLTAEALGVPAEPHPERPLALTLHPVYPNPVSGAAVLTYELPRAGAASLRVYDVLGREVAVLVEEGPHAPGTYEVLLQAGGWAAGVYLCVLEVGSERRVQRVTVVR